MPKESGIAKSIGNQKEDDVQDGDYLLYNYLRTGKKITKEEAKYVELQKGYENPRDEKQSCGSCKFNLPARRRSVTL